MITFIQVCLSFTYSLHVTSVYKSEPHMAHWFSTSQLIQSETRMGWIHAGCDWVERYIPLLERHHNVTNNRLKFKRPFLHLFRFEIYWETGFELWIYLFQQ